jgi:hypothetical protein
VSSWGEPSNQRRTERLVQHALTDEPSNVIALRFAAAAGELDAG